MDFEPNTILGRAWQRLARPLIALMIRNGVMYQDFVRLVKRSYVDVAEAEFGKRGRPTNQSRIALLTGLDRKEIKRIRDARDTPDIADAQQRPASDRLSRVLTGWYQDPRFMHAGQPRPLTIDDEFVQLCREYGGDVPTTTIAKELQSGGAIERQTDGKLRAVSRYYMPAASDPAALTRSAEVYRDIGDTLLHNLYRTPKQSSRFEGRASNARVARHYAADFELFLEQRGQAFLEDIDQWLHEKETRTHEDDATIRLGVGVYYVHDKEAHDA
ncbi:MAG: DUF6502 family protein [Gammaproteobacteria bacterium]